MNAKSQPKDEFDKNDSTIINFAAKKCIFVYLYILHLTHGNVIFDISLNPMLFKNIAHVGSLYLCICVFV